MFPSTLPLFSLHRDSVFRVAGGGIDLLLTDACALHPGAPDERRFSLTLRGPLQPQLEQGIHLLEHAVLGELAIFLVPVGRDAAGMDYQAIFN